MSILLWCTVQRATERACAHGGRCHSKPYHVDCKYYVESILKYRRKTLYRARTCARTCGGMAFY